VADKKVALKQLEQKYMAEQKHTEDEGVAEGNDCLTRKLLEERVAAHTVHCREKDATHLSALVAERERTREIHRELLAATLEAVKAWGVRVHATAGPHHPSCLRFGAYGFRALSLKIRG
jgi:hypothetical protein